MDRILKSNVSGGNVASVSEGANELQPPAISPNMAPFLSPASFLTPRHVDALMVPPWMEHGPFAFWLIESLRPRSFVELGTHTGFSYFSFCQAVKDFRLCTKCHAIDTWKGDDHAGFYDEDVFERVNAINAELYSGFSELIRARFDEALPYFADGEIELLHIDGRHGYDDVKTDFESWLPKLSSRGVVLFHDTSIRVNDFGVWKLWQELSGSYPSFEFVHGHGLGVLAIGADVPASVLALCQASPDIVASVRSAYSTLGKAVTHKRDTLVLRSELESRDQSNREAEQHIGQLRSELGSRDQSIREAEQHIAQLRAEIDRVRADAATVEMAATISRQELALARQALDSAEAKRKEALRALAGSQAEVREMEARAESTLASTQKQLKTLQSELTIVTRERDAIRYSTTWRATRPLRSLLGRDTLRPMRTALRRLTPRIASPDQAVVERETEVVDNYQKWINSYDTITQSDRISMQKHILLWNNRPTISVIMPCCNPPEKFLRLAIESVQAQIYPHWELCIADDASSNHRVREILNEYAGKDERIKLTFRDENGHISSTSNSAITLARGEFVALLDQDDAIPEHALYWVAAEIINHPDVELLYSDEDKIDERGERSTPHFKPDWNQELLHGQNYISHLGVYKRERLMSVGGFRKGFEGSQDWDLVLRFTENLEPKKIIHIPAVLYHWRMLETSTASDLSTKPYVTNAAQNAITESFERRGEAFTLERTCNGAYFLPRLSIVGTPLVSIIIPTRNNVDDLRKCLDSLSRTDYQHREILVIDNQSDAAEALAYLSDLKQRADFRVLRYPHPFNYAAMHNWAIPQARGEFICLLNNDTEVIDGRWLGEMVGQAQRPGVGAVGAKLLYPEGNIQHGGVITGIGGIAGHAHKHIGGNDFGYFGRSSLIQNFSAVTGACLVVRKNHWEKVDGMSTELKIAFNDVDFCLRLQEAGLRNVWLPQALLYHHESKSRGSDVAPDKLHRFSLEHAYMQWRWGLILKRDPAYNPNLTLNAENFSLAFPPRGQFPWRSTPAVFEVPYGVPNLGKDRLTMMPGETLKGSFLVPSGIRGHLRGMSLSMDNSGNGYDGTVSLSITDQNGNSGQAQITLGPRMDNDALSFTSLDGDITLEGQDRLYFSLNLDDSTQPIALFVRSLNERWGHQISGHDDKALEISLYVQELVPAKDHFRLESDLIATD